MLIKVSSRIFWVFLFGGEGGARGELGCQKGHRSSEFRPSDLGVEAPTGASKQLEKGRVKVELQYRGECFAGGRVDGEDLDS